MNIKKSNKILIGIIIILTLILISLTLFLFIPEQSANNELPTSSYNENAIKTMKEYNIYNEINSHEYSKTIEVILENDDFNINFLQSYYKIQYQPISEFSNIINTFLEKNYSSNEINYVLSNYSNNLDILLNMDYIDILQFKGISNFDINNVERYINYQNNNEYDIKTVVTYVNIGLDRNGYSIFASHTLEEANSNLGILVNKYNKLPDEYIPADLVGLSYSANLQLRKEAAEAFEKLTSAALIDNVIFYPYSAYRSYKTQYVLYNRYKAKDGEKLADTYSARPGFSEHQTGLAVDVRSNTLNDNLTPKDYEWMLKNSYKYGFIVRYPKGKQHITQFIEEPWHLRYLGIDLATKVTESGLTYDEYYDLYLKEI